jgi:tetratricopeptide (TPR) repeat protein
MLAVVAVLGAKGLLLCGCGESAARRTGRTLQAKVQVAQRLTGKALALMSIPVLADAASGEPIAPSEFAGVRAPADPNQGGVEVLDRSALHPEAWDALERAVSELTPILSEYQGLADADPSLLALGRSVLARAQWAQGVYKAGQASNARRDAGLAVSQTFWTLEDIQGWSGLASYFEGLLSMSNEDVNELISDLRRQRDELSEKLEQTRQQLRADKAQRQKVADKHDELMAQATRLRLESSATPGMEGLRLHEKAMELVTRANELASQMARLDYQIERASLVEGRLEMDLAEKSDRVDAAQAILDDRTQQVTRLRERRSDLRGRIGRSLQEGGSALPQRLAEAASFLGQARQAEDEAINALDRAAKRLRQAETGYRQAGRRDQATEMATKRAEVLMLIGKVDLRRLQLDQRVERLAKAVRNVWEDHGQGSLPEALAAIESYVTEPEQLRQASADRFAEAIDIYEKATKSAPRNERWAYEGRLAAAYAGQGIVQGDRELLNKARGVLDEALADKEGSAYLADLVRYRQLVDRFEQQLASEG